MTGTDKKLNYPNFRGIKINDEQNKNWNKNTSKLIRKMLENDPFELLKQLHKIMENRMDFTEKPTESEQEIILKIEELIK